MVLRFRKSLMVALVASLCVAVNARGSEYSGNMFLNGEYKVNQKSHPQFSINPASNIFLEHAIISRQASPFSGPTYLPPVEFLKCTNGQQCIRKSSCQNGFYTQQQQSTPNCNPETHICCTYRPPPPPPTPPRTTPKPYITCRRDQDCVSPGDCQNGEISSPNYIHGGSTSNCYSPNVCCLVPSTTLTEDGYKLKVPDTKFPLPTPPKPVPTTSYTKPPVYTKPPTVYTNPPPTPSKPNNEYLPPGTTRYTPSRPAPPQPTQPTVRYTPPAQASSRYTPPAPPTTRYTPPPQAPTTRYTPPPQTPTRYTPPPQAPTTRYTPQTPPRTPANREYLPPKGEESRTVTERIHLRGETVLSPTITPTLATFNVQVPFSPSKCASALVCTTEEYCNSVGVVSDTPVDLSPAARAFRVPLTDCILPDSGSHGKCCRDPNYVDPWPVNMAGVCGVRNRGTKPTGIQDIDANFGEIPWQAMILKQSTKTLICGGAIIGAEHVVTTANCLRGVSESDLRIKVGEWKLGDDNEPLPFQIVGAKYIKLHPTDDMAIVRLDKPLVFATHIKPICISDQDPSASESCITSGWGQQALRVHEQGAIMHVTDTNVLGRGECGANQGSVCSSTRFDTCQFDVGSALACGSSSSMFLKGVYSTENGCGEGQPVRFTKPDIKWINEEFKDTSKPIFSSFNKRSARFS